jgi:hypothetical protein
MQRSSPLFRLSVLSLALALGLACDATSNGFTTDTDGTPTVVDTGDPPPPPPTPRGVQIGSEGILTDCTQRTLADADQPAGFDTTAGALRTQLSITATGNVNPNDGNSAPLQLGVEAGPVIAFDGAGCPETVALPLSLSIDAAPALTATPAGWALVEPDGTGVFAAWAPDWDGSAEPDFEAGDYDTVALRVDGTIEDTAFVRLADLGFEGCTAGACDLAPYGVIALD